MTVQHPARDRHSVRHLRLVPPPPAWTAYEVAELIELTWATGQAQERLGIPTWRDRLSFRERVAVTAATLGRADQAPTRRRDVAPVRRRRARRPRGGAA